MKTGWVPFMNCDEMATISSRKRYTIHNRLLIVRINDRTSIFHSVVLECKQNTFLLAVSLQENYFVRLTVAPPNPTLIRVFLKKNAGAPPPAFLTYILLLEENKWLDFMLINNLSAINGAVVQTWFRQPNTNVRLFRR